MAFTQRTAGTETYLNRLIQGVAIGIKASVDNERISSVGLKGINELNINLGVVVGPLQHHVELWPYNTPESRRIS